jgi:molecular chaperone HscB
MTSRTTDPFATLGLPRRFDLGPSAVDRAYLARIAALHPDAAMSGGGGGEDGGHDDEPAAALNHAKAALLDDELRAETLLTLLGGPSKADERGLPPGFLQEMMDVRERLDEDLAADPVAARERWGTWAKSRRESHAETLRAMFAQSSPPLRDIRLILNQWRYVERMLEQIDRP